MSTEFSKEKMMWLLNLAILAKRINCKIDSLVLTFPNSVGNQLLKKLTPAKLLHLNLSNNGPNCIRNSPCSLKRPLIWVMQMKNHQVDNYRDQIRLNLVLMNQSRLHNSFYIMRLFRLLIRKHQWKSTSWMSSQNLGTNNKSQRRFMKQQHTRNLIIRHKLK